jgi:hypothetical protein
LGPPLRRRRGKIIGACLPRRSNSCLSQLNLCSLESINVYLLHLAHLDNGRHPPRARNRGLHLFAILVSNDFSLNLLDLHIHENGLERLFNVYKKILPSLGQCMFSREPPYQTSLLTYSRCKLASQRERDKHLQVVLDEIGQWGTGGVLEGIRSYELVHGEASKGGEDGAEMVKTR